MMNKKQLRETIKEKKRALAQEEIESLSGRLTEAFLNLPAYKMAKCLFAYVTINQEVRTYDIIKKALADGKKVALPRVTNDVMSFRFIKSFDDCEQGDSNILEPRESMPCADDVVEKALMLMPGLAFDRTGARVGYGKGHYDRYLAAHTQTAFYKIALCYDFQIVDHINAEEHDIRADKVIAASAGQVKIY